MQSLRAQTNFHLGEADVGAGAYPVNSLSINVDDARKSKAMTNNDTFLNSADLSLLENLLNSPVSVTDMKSTVKPAETLNGNMDDYIFDNSSDLHDVETFLSTHEEWNKEKMPNHKEQWGQITPCTDDSSNMHSPSLSRYPDLEDDAMDASIPASNASTKRTGKKSQATRSRQSSLKSLARKSSGSNGSKPAKNSQDSIPLQDDDVKRERFLKRNRVAASKCRQKKKEYISNLEERARELTSSRNHLMAYVASLKNEIIALKTEMLKHSDCNCVAIQEYLRREASLLGEMAEIKEYDKWCRGLETSPDGT